MDYWRVDLGWIGKLLRDVPVVWHRRRVSGLLYQATGDRCKKVKNRWKVPVP